RTIRRTTSPVDRVGTKLRGLRHSSAPILSSPWVGGGLGWNTRSAGHRPVQSTKRVLLRLRPLRLVGEALEDDAGVVPAEAEAVRDGDLHVGVPWSVRDVVEIA